MDCQSKEGYVMKKSISESKVKRMRNLATKKYSAKTEIRAGYTTRRLKRKEGEVWQEAGKTWTIKNGIKQTVSKLSMARKSVRTPLCCPKCGGSMKHHLSQKMYKIHGMCFNCVVKFETQLKIDGEYDNYSRSIMKGNYASWLKDMNEEYNEFLNSDFGRQYITEAGHIEDWSDKSNKDALLKEASENLERIKTEFEEKIDGKIN